MSETETDAAFVRRIYDDAPENGVDRRDVFLLTRVDYERLIGLARTVVLPRSDAAFVVTDEMVEAAAKATRRRRYGDDQYDKDIDMARAALTAALSLRSPATIPAPTFGPDLRCPECQCASFARINERKFDGSFGPGPHIRCVDCKRVYAYRRIAVADVLGRSEIPTPATIPAAVDAVATVEKLTNAVQTLRAHLSLFVGPDDDIANTVFEVADAALRAAGQTTGGA